MEKYGTPFGKGCEMVNGIVENAIGSSGLNVERLMKLDIPDLAPVYGGIRGRTMSSRHQEFAWPIIKECGIRTIIDLRADGINTRLCAMGLHRTDIALSCYWIFYGADKGLPAPEIRGDRILICTDGVYGNGKWSSLFDLLTSEIYDSENIRKPVSVNPHDNYSAISLEIG